MLTGKLFARQFALDYTISGNESYESFRNYGELYREHDFLPNPQQDFDPSETIDFCWFFTSGDGEPGTITVNDLRVYFDGQLGNTNLISTPVALNDTGGNVKIKVAIPSGYADKVRSNKFGIAFSVIKPHYDYSPSEHLVMYNIDTSSLPENATPTHIELELKTVSRVYFYPPTYPNTMCIYGAWVHIYYDMSQEGVELHGTGVDAGFLQPKGYEFRTDNVQKRYQYMVYDKGKFLGELTDVVSLPTIRMELNSFPSELNIEVARTPDANEQEIDEFEVIDDGEPEPANTDTGDTVNMLGSTTSSFGQNTMINTNNDIDVYEYNGHYEGFVLDDGEPLVLNDMQQLSIPIGSPEGKIYFTGYVSKYNVEYKKDQKATTKMTLLSHADELNNIILSSNDEMFLVADGDDNKYIGIGGGDASHSGYLNYIIEQWFDAPVEDTSLSTIYLKISRKGGETDSPSTYPIVTVKLLDENNNVLRTKSVAIQSNRPYWQAFNFDAPVILEQTATDYHFQITLENFPTHPGIYDPDVISLYKNEDYYYKSLVYRVSSNPGHGDNWQELDYSIQFKLATSGGQTLVPMYSVDPSQMFKNVIDYGQTKGSKVKYTENSIEMSGNLITAKFNVQTLKEAMDSIISYEPTDWSWYIDQSDLALYVNRRPEGVSHYFTLHKDIESIKLERSMEDMVNEVYFTGGKAVVEGGEPYENKRYIGGTADNAYLCTQIFMPEPGIKYKVYADYEDKQTMVKLYTYSNGSTTPDSTSVTEYENGKQEFLYEPTVMPNLTGICIAARAKDNSTLYKSKMNFNITSDNNVFRHLVDENSQNLYRKALKKKTDGRVTNALSADIIAQNEMDRNPAPIFAGTVSIIRDEHLEDITPGELVGFRGFGNYIDDLELLVMEVEKNRDTIVLSLGAFVPKTSKRLEDLKRNLTILEQEMNPSTPGGNNG